MTVAQTASLHPMLGVVVIGNARIEHDTDVSTARVRPASPSLSARSDASAGRPRAGDEHEPAIGQHLSASVPKLIPVLGQERPDIRSCRANAAGVGLPPLLEAGVLALD
jgi:hypothetical protein